MRTRTLWTTYLWEEVEAAQAADDAVDLGEPPAFAAGLQTARKNQNQNTQVSQDRSSNNNHGIRPVEQSKAFWTRRFEMTAEEKVNVFSAAKRRVKAWEDEQIYNNTLSIMKLPVRVSSNSKSSYQ